MTANAKMHTTINYKTPVRLSFKYRLQNMERTVSVSYLMRVDYWFQVPPFPDTVILTT
jgi:hypothetical protein